MAKNKEYQILNKNDNNEYDKGKDNDNDYYND